jgi:glycosyltransferase involved in cell wall biosynthesis
VDAIAAGVPVVATAFPHAAELLSDGAGIVVPHRDPAAIAAAVGAILTRPQMRASMIAAGRPVAERHRWDRVAGDYLLLAERSRLVEIDQGV